MEALRTVIKSSGACISLVMQDCVLLRKGSGDFTAGSSYAAPAFCFWTLVPEQPQALVIEDTLLDARYAGFDQFFFILQKP